MDKIKDLIPYNPAGSAMTEVDWCVLADLAKIAGRYQLSGPSLRGYVRLLEHLPIFDQPLESFLSSTGQGSGQPELNIASGIQQAVRVEIQAMMPEIVKKLERGGKLGQEHNTE